MCVYIYIYIYIHTYTYIYIYIYVVFRLGESPKSAALKVSRVAYAYVLACCVLFVIVCCIINCSVCAVDCRQYQSCVVLLLSSREMPSSAA